MELLHKIELDIRLSAVEAMITDATCYVVITIVINRHTCTRTHRFKYCFRGELELSGYSLNSSAMMPTTAIRNYSLDLIVYLSTSSLGKGHQSIYVGSLLPVPEIRNNIKATL